MAGEYRKFARAGLKEKLPKIDVFPNKSKGCVITIKTLEFTSVCPKTKLPDFGKIYIRYMPDKFCIELKSLKYYLLAYRNMGIFYENAISRICKDIVSVCKPLWAVISGRFNIRGGIATRVDAFYPDILKKPDFWKNNPYWKPPQL